MELEKFEFTDLLSNHESLDGFNPNWEQDGIEVVSGILDQIVSKIGKKPSEDDVSEILDQIVSEICKEPPPKTKKRSADNTEIDKKKGDKKPKRKDTYNQTFRRATSSRVNSCNENSFNASCRRKTSRFQFDSR